MFCQFCGAQMSEGSQFCPACGRQQQASAPPPQGFPPSPGYAGPPPVFTPPTGVKAQTGSWISQGWQLVKGDIGLFMLISLVYAVVANAVPLVLHGALMAGFYIACMKKVYTGRTEIGHLFKGFNFFVPALVASLIIGLFTFLGVLACIIGALVVAAMYQFTYFFIFDKKMDFWPAMQASHAIVKQDYVGFTLFIFVLGLLHIVGLLCCIVGIFVTIPIQFVATTIAYKELVGFEQATVDMA